MCSNGDVAELRLYECLALAGNVSCRRHAWGSMSLPVYKSVRRFRHAPCERYTSELQRVAFTATVFATVACCSSEVEGRKDGVAQAARRPGEER